MSNWLHLLPLVALPVVTTGCAGIGMREPKVTASHVVSTTREPEVSWRPTADADGEGTMAHIAARTVCAASEREYRVVERTYSRERYNAEAKKDNGLLLLGAISLGLGSILYFDANGLSSNNNDGGNSTSPSTYQGLGIALAAVGGAFMLVAAVDALRAQGSEDEVRTAKEKAGIVRRDVPCRDRPLPDAVVAFVVSGTRVEAGRTGTDGQLDVDLAKLLPAEAVLGDPDGWVGDIRTEPLSVEPLRGAFDEQVWTRESASRYLQLLPSGRHSASARETVDNERAQAEAKLHAQQAIEAAREAEQHRRDETARAAQAQVDAAQRARGVCRTQCSAACNAVAACASQCIAAKCH